MGKQSFAIALSGAWFGIYGAENARGAEPPHSVAAPAQAIEMADGPSVADEGFEIPNAEAAALAEWESLIVPLPEPQRIYTHTYRAGHITTRVAAANGTDSSASRAGLPTEKLIYSNTGGTRILRFNQPNRRYADDVQTDALSGCDLSRYVVRVNGGVTNGTGEFSCTTALFAECPTNAGGGMLIPGTTATFTGLTDDSTDYHDLVVDVSLSPVPIPANLWVRVDCSIGSAGWVGGTHAEVGFTQDIFFHPFTGCNSFVGPSFISGFYFRLWASNDPLDPCDTHFVAYATTPPNLWLAGNLTNTVFADEFQTILAPTGKSCILSAYEVAARGFSGQYILNTDLRFPFTDIPIAGTENTLQGGGDGRLRVARHVIDPTHDIIVPPTPLWLAWSVDRSATSLMLTDGPALGISDPYFSYAHSTLPTNPIQALGSFYLKLYCRGETPQGSCCLEGAAQAGSVCEDGVTATDCIGHRWLKEEDCASVPFDPPCGYGACCTPNDKCLDTEEQVCAALGGAWNAAETCITADSRCGIFACRHAVGECNQSHDMQGCSVESCCNAVCALDETCCTDSWDLECAHSAHGAIECSVIPIGYPCSNVFSLPTATAIPVDAQMELSIDNSNAMAYHSFCCAAAGGAWSSLYFRFVATHTSVRINTCTTLPSDAGDSLLLAYRVHNPLLDLSACSLPFTMACNDDRAGCGNAGTMSDLCATGLVPGETYYFVLASKSAADQGVYQLTIESPCPAQQLAGPRNEGIVNWLFPRSGTLVDARQPFDPDDPAFLQGITALNVHAPVNADDPACWSVCDTFGNPLSNEVVAVQEEDDGTKTLHLMHPLTPGALTKVTYLNGAVCTSATGQFSFLPGDVGGGNYVSTDDASNFGSRCLSAGTTLESCDINRSGIVSTDDLIRLIDLMNGAGPFDPWLGRTVSTAPCE